MSLNLTRCLLDAENLDEVPDELQFVEELGLLLVLGVRGELELKIYYELNE